jgi:preprotein translocase subunit Sec61beta
LIIIGFRILTAGSATLKKRRRSLSNHMSDRKNAPMPASSAGLLTFFNEETQGVKIRPEIVLIGAVSLIAVSIVINFIY